MIRLLFLGCFLIGFILFFMQRSLPEPFIPFDSCMGKTNLTFAACYQKTHKKKWRLLKKLYETNLSLPLSEKLRIPKRIHQIWIGGELPEKYVRLQKTWQEKHPDWEYSSGRCGSRKTSPS